MMVRYDKKRLSYLILRSGVDVNENKAVVWWLRMGSSTAGVPPRPGPAPLEKKQSSTLLLFITTLPMKRKSQLVEDKDKYKDNQIVTLSINDWLLLFSNCQRVTWTAYAIFAMCSDDYTCVCIPIEKSFQKVTVKVSFNIAFNCFAFPSSKLNILSAAAFQMLPFVSS